MFTSESNLENKKTFSIESLKQKNLPPALENFLFNLAVAEKIITV